MSTQPSYFSAQVSDARRFYLELQPGARQQITVISGGWEFCRADYDMRRPGFPWPIIEFVSHGEGTLRLWEREFPLKSGSVFVYGQGIPHRIRTSPQHAMMKYFVAFEGASELMRECQILPGTVLQAVHPDPIRQIFDDLIRHGLSDHAHRARMCQIALQYLITKIGDCSSPQERAGSAAAATYQRCRRFIEENYLHAHSLRDIAEACHVDSAYLCRLFRRFRRQTPFQYLQTLQMNYAVELLQNGNRSVKETAQELGFGDPYNFSRTFKRIFGVAPRHMFQRGTNQRGLTSPPD